MPKKYTSVCDFNRGCIKRTADVKKERNYIKIWETYYPDLRETAIPRSWM
jgi:hypothetical protein